MKINGIEILGRSVSGYATCLALPKYDICFDAGIATHEAVHSQKVAFTHGHLDHFGGLARHGYIRGMTRMETPDYIVPPWLTDAVHETFEFWARVQNNRIAPYNVIEASEGDDIHVKGKVFIRPFRTIHKVKSQGYTLFEKRKRLKAEFRGTPGPELGRLRRSGVEIESTEDVPLFTFTGDTKASVLDRMPEFALRAKVFAIECTFLGCDEVDEEQAERKGHVHIDQLARRADKFAAAGSVMLCHFSKRYSNKDIEAAIANLPASMRAKTTYMPVAK